MNPLCVHKLLMQPSGHILGWWSYRNLQASLAGEVSVLQQRCQLSAGYKRHLSHEQRGGWISGCNVWLAFPSDMMASDCLSMTVGTGADASDAAGALTTGSWL